MIKTQCVVCGNDVILSEKDENNPKASKYWSYEKDGGVRAYCDAMCGLLDKQNKKTGKK